MDKEMRTLFAELEKCSDDPTAFADIRRKILQRYFDRLPSSRRSRALALQDEIENVRIMAGTPGRAAMAILEDMGDQCEALEAAGRQLIRECAASRD